MTAVAAVAPPPDARPESTRRPVTLAAVRAKCRDCLGTRTVGFDCQVTGCPLYPWQPWQGRGAPSR